MEIFSEYFKKGSFLSKVDVRIKLAVSMILLIMALSYKGFAFHLVVFCICSIIYMTMKIPVKIILLRFSEPLFIAFFIVLLKLFFAGKDMMFSLEIAGIKITGHTDGLRDGLMIACRILSAVSIVITLGFSTLFNEIVTGLSWFKIPKDFIEILMFAYRYVFVLFEDATVIYNAQKNRLGYSNIRRGLGSFGALAGSLVIKAFEHSQNITTAMIQRGYDGNMPMLKQKPFKVSEISVSFLFIIVMGVIWKI